MVSNNPTPDGPVVVVYRVIFTYDPPELGEIILGQGLI